jgi:inner membrane protein
MFILGHVGITLGAAVLLSGMVSGLRSQPQLKERSKVPQTETSEIQRPKRILSFPESWFDSLARFLDIRLLIIGSLLPDIIDKPLRYIVSGNGRTITHTLLISLIVLIAGLFIYYRSKRTGLLALAFGMLSHLVLDGMWQIPKTLFWPVLGWAFPELINMNWFSTWWAALLSDPMVYIGEIVGFLVIIWFLRILSRRRQVISFLIKGRTSESPS